MTTQTSPTVLDFSGLWSQVSENNISFICTRKYMHAETPRLADKTIVFSEHEVFKVIVMVTR
jgi:hypothetical protein